MNILLFSLLDFRLLIPKIPQILALALVACAAAAPEAEPKAAADPYYYGGYGHLGYGLGYRTYAGYGLGGHYYGKRSAEAEPYHGYAAVSPSASLTAIGHAPAALPGVLRGYAGYGLGGHYYSKRSAEAEPKAEAGADSYYYGGYYRGLGYSGLGL